MPRVSPAITNFTAGEYSPQMFGQIDLASYPNACRLLRNFVCRVHGGGQKRPGTIFIAEVKDSTKETRLIPFQYSTEQAYVLELGNSYMRVFMDRGQVLDDESDPFESGTPYVTADLSSLRFAQDKDLMYLFLRSKPIQKLIRYDHDDWICKNAPIEDGPYLPSNAAAEIGVNLVPDPDMEGNTGWTSVGSPLVQEQSTERFYAGAYSRKLLALVATDGVKSGVFTTVTASNYRIRFRVFTSAGTLILKFHPGSDSGTLVTIDTLTGIPSEEWTEYERWYTETAGGAAAYIEFLGPAVILSATELITNGNCEVITGWTKTGEWAEHVIALDSAQKHAGTYSLKYTKDVSHAAETAVIHSANFYTEEGKWYKYSFWLRGDAANSYTYKIRSGDDSEDMVSATVTPTADTWTNYTGYYKETGTGGYAKFYISHLGAAGVLVEWRIDDVSIKEVTSEIFIDNVEIFKIDSLTMTPSAITGNGITLTASSSYFVAGHIGAFFRLTHDSTTGHVIIRSITSGTVAVADVITTLGDDAATDNFAEGAWSIKNGYPSCGCFFEQRLMVASSENDADAVWGSKPTEYEDFTPGVLDADPVAYKLQSDIIRWLGAMGQLVVGTVNAEYRLGAQSDAAALTPTNVKLTPQSRKGSSDLDPVNVGNAILFVQRRGNAENSGTKLRELSYNYVNDSYDGIDLSLFAEHISGSGFKRVVFMSSPFPILWGQTEDGRLVGMTYEREQKVIGWHYHPMDGLVEDICVIPGDNQDDLYMIVNRTIDGVEKRYIEVMADFDFGTDYKDAYFVDCGLSYDGSPTSSLSGLEHLEGKTVAILADGIVQTKKTVANGGIALDTAASVIHVGLPYTSELEPLDLQGGSIEGVSQGKIKRIHGVALYLYNSMGGEIGQDANTTERIFYKEETEGAGEQLDLFTGIKDDFNFSGDWQLDARVYIKHDDPLPFTVLSILPRFRTEDR
jgi:hypothetical protein